MVTLFLLFFIQFIIGSVCLALSYHVQSNIIQMGWNSLNNETKSQIENKFECCGFKNATKRVNEINCTFNEPCFPVLENSMIKALRLSGAIGLVFSLFQVNYTHLSRTVMITFNYNFSLLVYILQQSTETFETLGGIHMSFYKKKPYN